LQSLAGVLPGKVEIIGDLTEVHEMLGNSE
jgi:hypothetical protein